MQEWKLNVLNCFVVYFLIGPAMAVSWISLWTLIGTEVILPEDQVTSVWISFVIGYIGIFLASYFQDSVHKFTTSYGFGMFLVLSRLFSYAVFFVSANAWRSIWEGMDIYTGVSETNSLVSGILSYGLLILLRCSRTTVFTPCVLGMDFPVRTYFEAPTYFDVKKPRGLRRAADTLFTVFVVISLSFLAWRGIWEYIDHVIFPSDRLASGIFSLCFSYTVILSRSFLEKPLMRLNAKLYSINYMFGLLSEDIVTFLVCVGCITYWRGYLILYDLYIPGVNLRYWLGHLFSVIILFTSLSFNSVLARGCVFDGQLTDGQGVVHDIRFLSHFIQLWKVLPQVTSRDLCSFVVTGSPDDKDEVECIGDNLTITTDTIRPNQEEDTGHIVRDQSQQALTSAIVDNNTSSCTTTEKNGALPGTTMY